MPLSLLICFSDTKTSPLLYLYSQITVVVLDQAFLFDLSSSGYSMVMCLKGRNTLSLLRNYMGLFSVEVFVL